MPFLRFSRDKRGYEHTYVLHTFRREGSSQPRLLYWFRTPPGVRVGRHPLDERAIRAIEESYPNLSFDWSNMLKVRPAPPPGEQRRPKSQRTKKEPAKPAKKEPGRRSRSDRRPKASESGPSESSDQREDAEVVDVVVPAIPAVGRVGSDLVGSDLVGSEEASAGAVEVGPLTPVDAVPVGEDDLVGNEDVEDAEESEGRGEPWEHPVVTLMGEEMLARLRARYAAIRVRIAEKHDDAETIDPIRDRAEALDPDRWKTVEDAVGGIERFESEAEAVKSALGRRPPRARRK